MRSAIITSVGLLWMAVSAQPASAQWTTHLYGPHAQAATFETTAVQESSGIVASRLSPVIYWTHNDSGGSPIIQAVRLNVADRTAGVAHNLGTVQLSGASNIDWEDIAAGPGNKIYVFDGGDNPACDRTDKRIYRLTEPVIDPNGSTVALNLPCEYVRFEYPDTSNAVLPADTNAERYDCETLFVHPTTGDLYLVTKRNNSNAATSRVYTLSAGSLAWNSTTVHVLRFVADISGSVPSTPTGGDIDAWGRRVLIRNYGSAYEFTLPDNASFDQIFTQAPRTISLSGELQGEGICYAADGGDIITTSEVVFSIPPTFPVFITPWRLANLRATTVTAGNATIRWDTASALGSTVDFGTSTSYGQSVSDPAAVTSHALAIGPLLPSTNYSFRATSGSLVYPNAGAAPLFAFTTFAFDLPDYDLDTDVDVEDLNAWATCLSGAAITHGPGCEPMDLDGDLDVDLSDFGLLQRCLSGGGNPPDPDCHR